jgi:CubicO group peptidase (beta-lactamase class C family)
MKHLFITLSLLITSRFIHAQQLDSIRYVLDSAYAKMPFCANILIEKDGKTVLEQSYGYADAPLQKRLSSSNSFQVASVSKQFTAYGIMLLQHKGLLEYDSEVRKYLPSFPYPAITIRHLLNHTSGLPDFWNNIRPNLDTTCSNGNKEVLDYLASHELPLQFEPGSQFMYTDIGYDLLAMIIEKLSGKSYLEYMQATIFKPLGMKDTYAYMVTDIRRISNKNLARGHVLNTATGKFEYAHLLPKYNFIFYLGDFYGDGSVVTTAKDLARWSIALRKCELLSYSEMQPAFTPAIYNGKRIIVRDPDIEYGFGWFNKPGKMIYHSGRHPGNISVIYHFIDRDLTFIFLSNSETPDLLKLRNRVLSLL